MEKDTVTIVIPVYNGANYVRNAIESALAQTYSPIEIIVVNDGSNDEGATRSVVQEYCSRLSYIEKANGGVSSALNAGIAAASGQWISWLSHDDEYEPSKIANQVELALSYSDERFSYLYLCGGMFIDKDGHKLAKTMATESHARYSADEMLIKMAEGYPIGGCNLLLPRQAILECGGFDESLRYVQDIDLWIRLFDSGYGLVASGADKDVRIRIHGEQAQTRLRALWPAEKRIYMNRLATYLMKLDGGYKLVSKLALHCYCWGDYGGGKGVLELLEELNLTPPNKLTLDICKARGKCRQLARRAYHRVVHGIQR